MTAKDELDEVNRKLDEINTKLDRIILSTSQPTHQWYSLPPNYIRGELTPDYSPVKLDKDPPPRHY